MIKGNHLQLRCCPPFLDNFKCYNIKAPTAYDVDELLGKSAIESSICGAGFYSNVFVVSKCSGVL